MLNHNPKGYTYQATGVMRLEANSWVCITGLGSEHLKFSSCRTRNP